MSKVKIAPINHRCRHIRSALPDGPDDWFISRFIFWGSYISTGFRTYNKNRSIASVGACNINPPIGFKWSRNRIVATTINFPNLFSCFQIVGNYPWPAIYYHLGSFWSWVNHRCSPAPFANSLPVHTQQFFSIRQPQYYHKWIIGIIAYQNNTVFV